MADGRKFSSAGRASALQAEGHRFEPYNFHSGEAGTYGEIAQLARARGSYPRCRGFKSLSRYEKPFIVIWRAFSIFCAFSAGDEAGRQGCPCADVRRGISDDREGRKQDIMRIGTGYDVHRLAPDRELILGGVKIPCERGLLGHSDADVLLHAIMDALLGAAALDCSPLKSRILLNIDSEDEGILLSSCADRGISSLELLRRVGALLEKKGFLIENIDSTVIAQAPRLRPYIDEMRENIAGALKMETEYVSVKATTEEGLGFTGAGEGISAQAVCLLTSPFDLTASQAGEGCARCPGCAGAQNG